MYMYVPTTELYIYILHDGGLLHSTFYAHSPLKHDILCNNFLLLYFKTYFYNYLLTTEFIL